MLTRDLADTNTCMMLGITPQELVPSYAAASHNLTLLRMANSCVTVLCGLSLLILSTPFGCSAFDI